MNVLGIIIIVILLIAIIVGLFVFDNLLSQIKQLESYIEELTSKDDKIEEEVLKYYEYFLKIFTEAYVQMQRVDKRGSFSSDDEVGFAFKVLITSIETVKNKLTSMKNPEEEKTPENN